MLLPVSLKKGAVLGIICILILLISFYFNEKISTHISPPLHTIDDIPNLFILAENKYTEGDYEGSISLYKEIIELDPKQLTVYGKIAHVYRYWGEYQKSERWFLKAIELNPQSAWLLTDLGKLYRNTGQYDLAEKTFYKSLEIDPALHTTYSYGLGYLFFEKGEYQKSEKMFMKAMEINPTDEMVYSGLADLYREMGRYEDSKKMYEKAFSINPKSEAYLGIGWLYLYTEEYEKAEEAFISFLTNIREKGEVYYALGHTYTAMNQPEKAYEALSKAVILNPENKLFSDALASLESQ